MGLTWSLCDLTGASVADVAQPLEGSKITVGLNVGRTAELHLSLDDPAAAEVYPLLRAVKCWLDGVPIFAGPILDPDFDIVPERQVVVNASDPSAHLQASYVNNRSDTDFGTGAGVFHGATEDQSETIARLMEHASPTVAESALGVPGHGIVRGSLPASIVRSLPWPQTGSEVWKTMTDVTELDDSVDLELTPLHRTDGVLCQLDTHYPQQGADRSKDVGFEVGTGFNNATAMKWSPGGSQVRNRYSAQGPYVENVPPLLYRSNQPDSQLLFGVWQGYEPRQEELLSQLQVIARAGCAVSAFPPDNFEITPAQDDGSGWVRDPHTGRVVKLSGSYGQPPRFGPDIGGQHDYWIGDTVAVRAFDRPAITLDTSGRITDATLTQLASGAVLTELSANPSLHTTDVT